GNASRRAGGALGDVAPTVLGLQGLPVAAEMTGRHLTRVYPRQSASSAAMMLAPDVYRRRLEAVRQRLGGMPADGLFATPSSNLFYLTGIDFWRSERLTALVLFADRDPVVICPAFEESRLRGMSAVSKV